MSDSGSTPFVEPATPAPVQLDIYDTQGRRVRELVDGTLEAGEHELGWDTRAANGERVVVAPR